MFPTSMNLLQGLIVGVCLQAKAQHAHANGNALSSSAPSRAKAGKAAAKAPSALVRAACLDHATGVCSLRLHSCFLQNLHVSVICLLWPSDSTPSSVADLEATGAWRMLAMVKVSPETMMYAFPGGHCSLPHQ